MESDDGIGEGWISILGAVRDVIAIHTAGEKLGN
jgi:hypothetical protein